MRISLRVRGNRDKGEEERSPFLRLGEPEQFAKPGRRLTRRVISTDPTAGVSARVNLRNLDKAALYDLPELKQKFMADRRKAGEIRCRVIKVREGDGMSWSAAFVDETVAKHSPELERIRLWGEPAAGGLPEVSKLMSRRQFAVLCHKSGMTPKFRFLDVRTTGIVVAAAVAVSLVVALLTALLKPVTSTPSLGLIIDLRFLGIAVLLAGGGLLAQWLNARIKLGAIGDPSDDLASLGKELAESKKGRPHVYEQLVEAFTKWVRGAHVPRVVIVDRFETLDPLTRDVILRYFAATAPRARGFELWVIFETLGTDDFSAQAAMGQGHGYQNVSVFEQVTLSHEERTKLAQRVKSPETAALETVNPETADLETVKAICASGLDGGRMEEFFSNYIADHARSQTRYDLLDFFYLLSLAFTWGGPPPLDDNYVEQNFVYAGVSLLRLDVLRLLLPGTALSADELRPKLDELLKAKGTFQRYLEPWTGRPRSRGFRIQTEVGRWLENKWEKYSLIFPGLEHIFWTFFWYDKTRGDGPPSPFWTRKLAGHIRRTGPLTGLNAGLSRKVRDTLFTVTTETAEASLRSSLLEDVPILLDRAQSLLQSDVRWRRRAEKLRTVCWRAFALTGDARIQTTVDRLQRVLGTEPQSDQAGADDVLKASFLQSMNLAGSLGSTPEDKAMTRYMHLRGLWLGLTVQVFVDLRQSPFVEARSVSALEQAKEVRTELDRLQNPASGRRHALDSVNLSMQLWCLTICFARSHSGESHAPDVAAIILEVLRKSLDFVEVQKAEASPERVGGGDAVLTMLAKELALLVCCVALFFRRTGAEGETRTELVVLARRSFQVAGIGVASLERKDDVMDPAVLSAIEHHLELIHLVWAGLGFRQLSSFTNLRRAHLRVLTTDPADAAAFRKEIERACPGRRAKHCPYLAACCDPTADPATELARAQAWLRDLDAAAAVRAASELLAEADPADRDRLSDDVAYLELSGVTHPFHAPSHWAPYILVSGPA